MSNIIDLRDHASAEGNKIFEAFASGKALPLAKRQELEARLRHINRITSHARISANIKSISTNHNPNGYDTYKLLTDFDVNKADF